MARRENCLAASKGEEPLDTTDKLMDTLLLEIAQTENDMNASQGAMNQMIAEARYMFIDI